MEKKSKHAPLYLIDGNSLFYRSFYALPETMKTSGGIMTNAVYGFLSMLLRIIEEHPGYIAVAFDKGKPTFRHKHYAEYKATRQKAPDALRSQFPIIKEFIKEFNIPIFEEEGFEADDIIATIAKKAESEDIDTVIVTGDKDSFQLVSPKIKALITIKGISETALVDEKGVEEKIGVGPEFITDYKALRGDPSDNIPGIPGIGEKTAVALIKQFGSLEQIISNVDKVESEKLKQKIKDNIEIAKTSKMLATLIYDVPIKYSMQSLEASKIDWTRLLPLFEKYEFKSFVKKYGQKEAPDLFSEMSLQKVREKDESTKYMFIDTQEKFSGFIETLSGQKEFAFDTETTSLNTIDAELVGISFSFNEAEAYFVPSTVLSRNEKAFNKLKKVFADEKIKKFGHNIKYDIEVLKNSDITVNGIEFDSMIGAYLLDPESKNFGLKFLASKYFNKSMITFEELRAADKIDNLLNAPLKDLSKYACADADMTYRLSKTMEKELKDQDLYDIFSSIEVPLVEVLAYMEISGISIDTSALKEISHELTKKLKRLETEIHVISGETFNINSPKQLSEILFKKLQLPTGKKTKTGASTDVSVLESLAGKFEIAQKLLDFRQISKLLSTYVDVLPTLINKKTGRIHTSFNQVVTATGRLSSSNPNLQNIPIKSDYGKLIRKAFVPERAQDFIISADYSQIELRILAHLSQDKMLMEDFEKGRDVHQSTAAEIYDVKPEDVTSDMRNHAKTINFGIVYGMSPFGLSKTLGIKKTEAETYINKYFLRYKGVKKYMDSLIEFARENGYVKTILGRKRFITNIKSGNMNERLFAERMAINTPVQGSAADMIKAAMIKIYKEIKDKEYKTKMILQIHDELLFECPKEELEDIKKMIHHIMPNAVPLSVPVKVDIGVGKSWGEAKE